MRSTFSQESDFRQERDFGQKISATFDFLAGHWRPLGRVLLYLVLPAALLQSILSVLVQLQLQDVVRGAVPGRPPSLGGVLGTQRAVWENLLGSPTYWLSAMVGISFFTLLMLSIYSYIMVLLARRAPGPEVTVAEVWAEVKRGFVGTFFSMWGVFLLIGVASFFLVLPGLYLSVALSIFFVVKQAEGTGFGATLSRCLRLTKGKWWSTFGLILIMALLLYMFLIGIGVIGALLASGFGGMAARGVDPSSLAIATTSLTTVLMALIYPLLLLALAFQYFNLVERTDGVGLRRLVDTLGQPATPAVSNAAYRPEEEGEY